jgi:hypothetical protein
MPEGEEKCMQNSDRSLKQIYHLGDLGIMGRTVNVNFKSRM